MEEILFSYFFDILSHQNFLSNSYNAQIPPSFLKGKGTSHVGPKSSFGVSLLSAPVLVLASDMPPQGGRLCTFSTNGA